MDQEIEQLEERADEKILIGKELIERLEVYAVVPGVQKIQRKINQEIKFLQKVIKNETLKLSHVQCSNLTHYEFLVKILQLQRDVIHLDCGFALEERTNPLRVDIVCEHGLKWIKAIARNAKSLTDAAKGDASFGARSILDQAREFVDASALHLCMFQQPKVVFYFSQEMESDLLDALRAVGVETASLTDQSAAQAPMVSCSAEIANIGTINLDITTLLAYISNVCNGNCHFVFRESILSEQAQRERETPLKPLLEKLFAGKRLICCETAHACFQEIVSLLAGPQEKQRAVELMRRVEIMPDVADIPDELTRIRLSGKINQRSLKIFAFGLQMKALTVSSNKAFVRSTKMQGINVPVTTHQARALTEAKEATATQID